MKHTSRTRVKKNKTRMHLIPSSDPVTLPASGLSWCDPGWKIEGLETHVAALYRSGADIAGIGWALWRLCRGRLAYCRYSANRTRSHGRWAPLPTGPVERCEGFRAGEPAVCVSGRRGSVSGVFFQGPVARRMRRGHLRGFDGSLACSCPGCWVRCIGPRSGLPSGRHRAACIAPSGWDTIPQYQPGPPRCRIRHRKRTVP